MNLSFICIIKAMANISLDIFFVLLVLLFRYLKWIFYFWINFIPSLETAKIFLGGGFLSFLVLYLYFKKFLGWNQMGCLWEHRIQDKSLVFSERNVQIKDYRGHLTFIFTVLKLRSSEFYLVIDHVWPYSWESHNSSDSLATLFFCIRHRLCNCNFKTQHFCTVLFLPASRQWHTNLKKSTVLRWHAYFSSKLLLLLACIASGWKPYLKNALTKLKIKCYLPAPLSSSSAWHPVEICWILNRCPSAGPCPLLLGVTATKHFL